MNNPKIFVFAPVEQADECHQKLEKYGCNLSMGQAGWHSPQGDNERDMIEMAKDAISSGLATEKMKEFVDFTKQIASSEADG